MIEMSRHMILLRVRSWMVTSVFMVLNACCAFTYPSIAAGAVGLCMVFSLFMLFITYQNPHDAGHTFWAYLSLGGASIFFVQVLYLMPLLWVLTIFLLQSFNWRTWVASLLGILAPYWLLSPIFIYRQDFDTIANHFAGLVSIQMPEDADMLTPIKIVVLALIALLTTISALHFWRESYKERIRTRQIYNFMQWLGLAVCVFILLQPQHYDILIRIVLICASPYIAHFFTVTHSKIVNYLFFGTMVLFVTLAMISTSETLINYTNTLLSQLWNG